MQLKDIVIQEKEHQEKILAELKEYLKEAPEGTFYAAQNGKYYKWYSYNNGKRTVIRKQERDLAYRLAKKIFARFRLKETEKELKAIHAYLQRCSDKDNETFLQKHEAIRQLISENTPLPDRVREWANAPYPADTTPYKGMCYKTLKGDMVKSQAEKEIANALYLAGIPYRYECKWSFDGGKRTIYPDFVIMHPLTGKILIWEHFGMEDLNYYRHKNADKMYLYFDNGFVPGLNLITTVSNDEVKLTPAKIQETIHYYFHEWLSR